MQAQAHTLGRIISYDNDRGPLTLTAAILKAGKKLPCKPRPASWYASRVTMQADRPKRFPDGKSFAHRVMRDTINEAYEYAADIAKGCGNAEFHVLTALHVLMNTIGKELEKQLGWNEHVQD